MGEKKTDRRNLDGKLNGLLNCLLALLKRTLHVNVSKLLAEIGLGGEELDQTVLDRKLDVGTFVDRLLHCTAGLDQKLLATI